MKVLTRIGALLVATVAFATACWGPSSEPAGDVGAGPAPAGALRVVAEDNSFSPASLELPAGEEVTIEIVNEGDSPHDFTIEGLDLNTGTIPPGEARIATFVVPPGEWKFLCTFHRGMDGMVRSS